MPLVVESSAKARNSESSAVASRTPFSHNGRYLALECSDQHHAVSTLGESHNQQSKAKGYRNG